MDIVQCCQISYFFKFVVDYDLAKAYATKLKEISYCHLVGNEKLIVSRLVSFFLEFISRHDLMKLRTYFPLHHSSTLLNYIILFETKMNVLRKITLETM